ncbi:MAG: GNAT family N-acetyltransferase [Bacillota bacterium]
MIYTDHVAVIRSEQLGGFFVGWPNPPQPDTHLRLLEGSSHALLAVDDATGKVVGFITAISDGVLSAYIPLLEVLPTYQGQGIGTQLVSRMIEKLNHLYMVDLLCDESLQPFYRQLGMHQADGMMLRHFNRQSGALGDEQRQA